MAISKIKGSAIQDATIPEEKLEDEAGSFRMILDASDGSATDAGDFLLLDATASSTNVGEQFLFEPATDDGSAVLSGGDLNLENFKLSEMDKNSTIKSENGAVTTNIVQGLAKMWCRMNYSSGTPVASDSLNVSSLDDDGTGDIDYNFVNNPSSLNCSTVTSSATSATSTVFSVVETTANVRTLQYDLNANAVDQNNSVTMHGDLA